MRPPAKPVRSQRIDIGGTHAIKHGTPWGPGNVYHQLMEMT
jgi:hypothetical protein